MDTPNKTTVFVFGNPDITSDSLPLRILPALKQAFSDVSFIIHDPNEEWNTPEPFVMIDTIFGIEKVTVFTDLDHFTAPPAVSLHDFDTFSNIRYLQKLGKLKTIIIIGIPPNISEKKAISSVTDILQNNIALANH